MFYNANLKTIRQGRGITQSEAAALAGVSERTYQRYEQGRSEPGKDTLLRICETLGCSLSALTDTDPGAEQDIDGLAGLIIERFGPQQQAIILIEEMSELTKVLCKIQRGKFDRGKLNEEFTHVQVSCEVIRRIMGIRNADISDRVREKLIEYSS